MFKDGKDSRLQKIQVNRIIVVEFMNRQWQKHVPERENTIDF